MAGRGKKTSTKKTESKRPKRQSAQRGSCFVIAPFRGPIEKDPYWNSVFKPAIVAAELIPKRADDIYVSREIIGDIWKGIRNSSLVVADLTGRKPNVMYELGLAHAVGRPAILVARTPDELPFDLAHYRTIFYNVEDPGWGDSLRVTITQFVLETLKEPQSAVPTPFLVETKPSPPAVTADEKRFRELQHRIESLESGQRASTRWPWLNYLQTADTPFMITGSPTSPYSSAGLTITPYSPSVTIKPDAVASRLAS